MMRLEEIRPGNHVQGIHGGEPVEIRSVRSYGDSFEVDYRLANGQIISRLLTRSDEASLSAADAASSSFSADADDFKLASECHRILLAGRFDPFLAVRLSTVDPLPHQIDAVYNQMLPKLPLRYVLADDPGAGKTVMTGLLIKEMLIRGDLERCLIVVPGSICEQWRDELKGKFNLDFEILTNDLLSSAAAASTNPFTTHNRLIARMDKLARDEKVQTLLKAVTWDLVVVDEAHKLAAHVTGKDVEKTKRYRLGEHLRDTSESLLLLTATPHNGKACDFQLFMQLIDEDRFEGAAHYDPKTQRERSVQDVLRRMLKEQLLKFDGTPLFPERRSYTVNYELSDKERELYEAVTTYVRDEFNRAERLDPSKRNAVGFALTLLQRRLASSPAAIYESLRRRKARLEEHLHVVRAGIRHRQSTIPNMSFVDVDVDDDLPVDELEDAERQAEGTILTSQTVEELEAEIATLGRLVQLAERVRFSRVDRKWTELSRVLQENGEIFGSTGRHEKLIIFTEFTDTLLYLQERISDLIGDPEAVAVIHGGLNQAERREVERAFRQDENVRVLIATDAAGESINLQCAHLMVSYDLPWNPNRLEQRFGRIHRIGQTEVCHLWNLISNETREGQVYSALLQKLEVERKALGGRVYDVLGLLTFDGKPLSELLREAIRYGDDPEVRERLNHVVEASTDFSELMKVLEERALDDTVMGVAGVQRVREDMERELAHKLEPHFVASCFMRALRRLGGSYTQPEPGRLHITKVPQKVREKALGLYGEHAVLRKYERVCFERSAVHSAKPEALFVYPGHPLVDSVLLAALDEIGEAREQGTILVAPHDWGTTPKLLFSVEGEVCDGKPTDSGMSHTLERYLSYVEIPGASDDGESTGSEPIPAGNARYLDYDAPKDDEREAIEAYLGCEMPFGDDAWGRAKSYAVNYLAKERRETVAQKRLPHIAKVRDEVSKRLSMEISKADYQALQLAKKAKEHSKYELAASQAKTRVEQLKERKARRLAELEKEEVIFATPPRVSGCSIVIPRGLIAKLLNIEVDVTERQNRNQRIEAVAMNEVMKTEEMLGYAPKDVSRLNVGYDVESARSGAVGSANEPLLRFIEVKGVSAHTGEVTVTTNEVQQALNNPDSFILAIVVMDSTEEDPVVVQTIYLKRPFVNRLDLAGMKITYGLKALLKQGEVIYQEEGAL